MEKQTSRSVREETGKKEREEQRLPESRGQQRQSPLPSQQLTGLLESRNGLFDLPPRLLEELARAVGNSSLGEFISGGGEGPATYSVTGFDNGEVEGEANEIRTSTPKLFCAERLRAGRGRPIRASRPQSLLDRNAPGKSSDYFGTSETNAEVPDRR